MKNLSALCVCTPHAYNDVLLSQNACYDAYKRILCAYLYISPKRIRRHFQPVENPPIVVSRVKSIFDYAIALHPPPFQSRCRHSSVYNVRVIIPLYKYLPICIIVIYDVYNICFYCGWYRAGEGFGCGAEVTRGGRHSAARGFI